MTFKVLIAKSLRAILQPASIDNSKLNKHSRVCSGAHIKECIIGKYSYIGHDVFALKTSFGNYCSIADNCRIGGHEHDFSFVSTSPVFHSGRNLFKINFANFMEEPTKNTHIGSDVWIGANSIIKSGINIGNGVIIGAGSVVTHDVPDFEIWAGCPAKKIKDRFPPEIISELLTIEWWNWDDETIKKYAGLFDDPLSLISEFKKKEM